MNRWCKRANSQDEQTQEAELLRHIPAKCVVLHVNHQTETVDHVLDEGNKKGMVM